MRGHRHSALVVLLVLLVACAPAATPTLSPTPTPSLKGKVSVGDHQLYFRCSGAGSPTVVVEEGYAMAGASTRAWDAVLAGVEPVTRICLYDRAPLGLSKADIPVRTCDEVVEDLHKLLQNAHIGGPYVLVGHSLGGFYVRYYATKYADELVGTVLVDAKPPDSTARELALLPPASPTEAESITSVREGLVEELADSAGANAERLNFVAANEQAAKLTTLGDMPLVVLSRSPTPAVTYVSGLPADLEARLEQLWQDMQVEQSKLSTKGSLVVATKAGHRIHVEEPQLVIDAILQVVEEARKR